MPAQKCTSCGVKVQRAKRPANNYNEFVKTEMQDLGIKALPPKERMNAVAGKWKARSPPPSATTPAAEAAPENKNNDTQ